MARRGGERPRGSRAELDDRPYYSSGQPTRPASGRRSAIPFVAAALALLCAGGLWLAYAKLGHGWSGSTGIPLIHADPNAFKVRPEASTEGAPDEKDVYNMGQAAPQTERLLPPPEQPMAKPVPPPPVVEAPAPSAVTAPPAGEITEPAPAPAGPATPAPAAPATPPPTPRVSPVKPPPPLPSGSFRVQIAATRDEATAHAEWGRMQHAHPDLLSALAANYVRVDLGERGIFWRIQAGPLADKAAADKLCQQLKAVSIGCLVVRPQ